MRTAKLSPPLSTSKHTVHPSVPDYKCTGHIQHLLLGCLLLKWSVLDCGVDWNVSWLHGCGRIADTPTQVLYYSVNRGKGRRACSQRWLGKGIRL